MYRHKISIYSKNGNHRERNEDNFYVNNINRSLDNQIYQNELQSSNKSILMVFDGVGGEKNGDKASFCAADKVKEIYNGTDFDMYNADWNEIISDLNDCVCSLSSKLGYRSGTTIASIRVNDRYADICNLGDSRVYLFRNNELVQLSKDHTENANLIYLKEKLGIEIGEFSYIDNNSLTQYLGIGKDEFEIEPYMSGKIEVKEKDIFLLCTDGLTHFVDDKSIADIIKTSGDLHKINELLYRQAINNGSNDNITIILMEVEMYQY